MNFSRLVVASALIGGGCRPAAHAEASRSQQEVADRLEENDSGFGRLTTVRHAATLSETPVRWARPSVPTGTHPPEWP